MVKSIFNPAQLQIFKSPFFTLLQSSECKKILQIDQVAPKTWLIYESCNLTGQEYF